MTCTDCKYYAKENRNMDAIRLVELFSGIGAFSKALANLGIPYERVAMCEIDPHAIKVYEALHGPTPNLGDISNVEHLPDCDLLTYSFPCQDLSNAGKKQGMSKGKNTCSGLLWEVERLLLDAREREREGDGQKHLPRHLIMENVDAILYATNMIDFEKWIKSLTYMGYTSSYAVLDASDYGVPQKRKRCFMVSAIGYDSLIFPPACPDGRVLKDILEVDVPDKFYLSEKAMDGLRAHNIEDRGSHGQKLMHMADLPRGYDAVGRVYSPDGLSPTITTCGGGDRQPKILIEGEKMNKE